MGYNAFTKLGHLQLNSPIIIGANDQLIDFNSFALIAKHSKQLGAFVTKSCTLKSRIGNPEPIIACVENNVLVSSGLRNPGINKMLPEIIQYQAKYPSSLFPHLIVSIASDPDNHSLTPMDEYTQLACQLYENGITSIELNLSCPNLNKHEIIANNSQSVYEIIHSIKQAFARKGYNLYTLIAKLAGSEETISQSALAAVEAGIDAITILPLLRATAFYTGLTSTNINHKKIGTPLLGNIHGTTYGSGLGPITRQLTVNLSKIIKVPIIASGGCLCGMNNTIIEKTDGLIQTLLSGAQFTAAVSAFFPFTPDKLEEIDLIIDNYRKFTS